MRMNIQITNALDRETKRISCRTIQREDPRAEPFDSVVIWDGTSAIDIYVPAGRGEVLGKAIGQILNLEVTVERL